MTDFLQLLAAQFENQDITNPTDNTEYISELAQFASNQSMNTLTTYADNQYASSLVGKTVVVKSTDSATGKASYITGPVRYADFSSSDGSSIVVGSKAYDLSSVMQVLSDSEAAKTDSGSGTSNSTGGDDSSAG